MVSNRQNAQQSEIFTEFRLKSSIKPKINQINQILKSILVLHSINLPSLCLLCIPQKIAQDTTICDTAGHSLK